MTCKACEEQQQVAYYRLDGADVGIIGCDKHVMMVFDALDVDGWSAAASGIMTTDTLPKGASEQINIDGSVVTITGRRPVCVPIYCCGI